MRCQKARSCLSAYCSGELGERQSLEIRAHLAGCSGCREAERSWLALREATRELPVRKTSADFNSRLLNRIAEERFVETRQSVPQPSSLGWLRFRQWIPAMVSSAALVVLAATGVLQRGVSLVPALVQGNANSEYAGVQLDDAYLTAQPGAAQQRRLSSPLPESQSLHQSMAFADRVSRLSRGLSPQYGFGAELTSGGEQGYRSPYADDPFPTLRGRAILSPGSMVIRREVGFNGQTIRIYLMPSPDSQTHVREDETRY